MLYVHLWTRTCAHCGATSTSAAQHKANLRRLAARKSHYGAHRLGEEFLAFRKAHALDRGDCAALFGITERTWSLYESERSRPHGSLQKLIHLTMDGVVAPEWLKALE